MQTMGVVEVLVFDQISGCNIEDLSFLRCMGDIRPNNLEDSMGVFTHGICPEEVVPLKN